MSETLTKLDNLSKKCTLLYW